MELLQNNKGLGKNRALVVLLLLLWILLLLLLPLIPLLNKQTLQFLAP